MIKCLVPSNLNPKKLLERHPVTEDSNTHKDRVYFICHSIMQQMEFLKGPNMIHKDKSLPYYVPLKSEYLIKCLGSRVYKSLLDWMILAGIIESDKSWLKKKVSIGYRFTDHYLGANHRWITLTSPLIKKLALIEDDRKNPFCPQVICRLKKWFDPNIITIDAKSARKEIRNTLKSEIEAALKSKSEAKRIKMIFSARVKARKNENAVNNFSNGIYSFSQDDFGYRFHSPLTRIGKKLRKYIRCNGQELIQLDISGSQLYFGNHLFNPTSYLQNRKNSPFINKYKYELWNKVNNKNNNTIMYPLDKHKKSETLYSKGLHHTPYFEKTVEGSFYEGIVEELNDQAFFPEHLSYEERRGKLKKSLLALLFGDEQNPEHRGLYNQKNIKILNAFEKMYPDAALLFRKIKNYHTKALCQLLQRIESICMLGLVCKRLQNEYPSIPIYTIHDCIATTPEFVSLVNMVMYREFENFIGAAPKINMESWQAAA